MIEKALKDLFSSHPKYRVLQVGEFEIVEDEHRAFIEGREPKPLFVHAIRMEGIHEVGGKKPRVLIPVAPEYLTDVDPEITYRFVSDKADEAVDELLTR